MVREKLPRLWSMEVACYSWCVAAIVEILQQAQQAVSGTPFATSVMYEKNSDRLIHFDLTGSFALQFGSELISVDEVI